jgi:hypothetical protein
MTYHELVINEACYFFNTPVEKVLSLSRKAELVQIRRIIANTLRFSKFYNYTSELIAAVLKKDNHSTVLNLFRGHDQFMEIGYKKYVNSFIGFSEHLQNVLENRNESESPLFIKWMLLIQQLPTNEKGVIFTHKEIKELLKDLNNNV